MEKLYQDAQKWPFSKPQRLTKGEVERTLTLQEAGGLFSASC
jgi:hypothetical protein